MSHDESIAKDMSLKDSGSDLSHRPKRRRFHESYNFNMKCPTPGCNSLGECAPQLCDCWMVQGAHCDPAFQTLQWFWTQSSHEWKLFLTCCPYIITDLVAGKYNCDELFTSLCAFPSEKFPPFLSREKQKWKTSSLEMPHHVAQGWCLWGLTHIRHIISSIR